jgi:hypothetical protein
MPEKTQIKTQKNIPLIKSNLRSAILKIAFVFFLFTASFVSRANINFLAPVTNIASYQLSFTAPWMFSGMYPDEMKLNSFYEMKMEVYDSLQLDMQGLSRNAFELAIRGMEKLIQSGFPLKDNIISIADFSQPSTEKRLYVIDLNDYSLLYRTYVAHGRNSGTVEAQQFSNRVSSYKSSLGFYVTGNTYRGKHGYSLRLEGLEKGINDNAGKRAIVVHGADYVAESAIRSLGYLGRSQGCPAIPEELHRPIINEIKDGTCLFIYKDTYQYLSSSRLLN